MDKLLVAFHWNCGRMGDLHGLFVTTQEELNRIIGREVYFGEVLGKHSEIFGTLDSKDFTVKSDDQEFIKKLVDIIRSKTISGINPFDYYEPDVEAELADLN